MIWLARVRAVKQSVHDDAGVQQVPDRAEELHLPLLGRARRGLQVGPGRWDQALAAVRQDQDEIELAPAAHPAEHRQRPALERVTAPDDRDLGREALEMGSVSCLLSTASTIKP
jgi:hypothetical protein